MSKHDWNEKAFFIRNRLKWFFLFLFFSVLGVIGVLSDLSNMAMLCYYLVSYTIMFINLRPILHYYNADKQALELPVSFGMWLSIVTKYREKEHEI